VRDTETVSDHDESPDDEQDEESWAVDAALGAASILARTANAMGSSVPGRIAASATKRLTRPLAKEGHEVREQIEEDVAPTAKRLVSQVAPRVADVVDVDVILDALDINAILDRIDFDRLLQRVDLSALLEQVDLNALLTKVDLDALLTKVDLGAILDKVDVQGIIDKVDVQALIDRVDVEAIIDRVDVGAIVERVDIDALLTRVDVNGIVDRMDIDSLVQNTELGGLIAKSTSGVASSALDAVRSQGVGLDGFIERWVNRVARRDPSKLPEGPPLLVPPVPLALPSGDPQGADTEAGVA